MSSSLFLFCGIPNWNMKEVQWNPDILPSRTSSEPACLVVIGWKALSISNGKLLFVLLENCVCLVCWEVFLSVLCSVPVSIV